MTDRPEVSWGLAFVAFLLVTGCRSSASTEAKRYEFLSPTQYGSPERVFSRNEDSIWARLPLDSVRLNRAGCGMAVCPSYTVELRRDGSATYRGDAGVSRTGTWTGTVSVLAYGRLNEFAERSGLLDRDRPKPDRTVVESDGWQYILDLWPTGAREPIEFKGPYQMASTPVWILGSAIDGVSDAIRWEEAGK